MPVIGITGSVGAGKSAAAAAWGRLGCTVLDADRMGHDALDAVREAVATEFGRGCLAPDGRIDRAALARRVFGDPAALRRLEELVHPVVRDRLGRELDAAREAGPRAVVVDCALLFEGGLDALCDATVVVEAPEEVRLRRTAVRGWTEAETRRREAAQLPAAEKRRRADRVLANDGSLEDLEARAAGLLGELVPGIEGARDEAASGRSER